MTRFSGVALSRTAVLNTKTTDPSEERRVCLHIFLYNSATGFPYDISVVQWNKRCPVKGDRITVYFEKGAPAKFAVIV